MTTETVSTRSVLRVIQTYDNGSVVFVDENDRYIKLPMHHVRHIGNLTKGDEVEMTLALARRDDPMIDTLGVTLDELSEAVRADDGELL